MNEDAIFTLFPEIETENLILRRPVIQDAAALYKICGDKTLLQFYDFPLHQSLADSEKFIENTETEYKNKNSLYLILFHKNNSELIGMCRFYQFNLRHRFVSVGFKLAKNYWGQGLMNEALRKSFTYLFRKGNINRIEAQVFPRNERSVNVLEKIGFQKEGFMRENFMIGGRLENSTFYSLLKKDFLPELI